MCKRKNWEANEEKYGEWGDFLLRRGFEVDLLEKAFDEFSTDPKAREIGHLFAIINKQVGRDKMEEQPDLSKYRHKGRGPNLAPAIMEIIDMDPPEKWQKMVDLSRRMINEGPEAAKTEWYKTLQYAEKELASHGK